MIYVFGAGGHAAEILDAARLLPRDVTFVVETDAQEEAALARWGGSTGPTVRPSHVAKDVVEELIGSCAILAIGDPDVRARIAALPLGRSTWRGTAHDTSYREPSSRQRGWMEIGTYQAAFSYIGPYAVLGDHVHVNRGAMVSHDCVVGSYCHIAPGAQILGACRVGERTEVGANAIVLPKVTIGSGCRIGAGAIVTRDVPDNVVVRMAEPARVSREIAP